ncbi:MAG: hypothetical protein ACO39X_06920, partial [Candidatus Nanopelagicaceae bacterium]
ISGSTIDNYNYTFDIDSIKETNTPATLSSNTVFTNGPSALWYGDMRDSGTNTTGNQFSIEFESNDLIRMASNQDERWAYRDDQCYSVYKSAKLKIELIRACSGTTIAPYVRILGVCIGQ